MHCDKNTNKLTFKSLIKVLLVWFGLDGKKNFAQNAPRTIQLYVDSLQDIRASLPVHISDCPVQRIAIPRDFFYVGNKILSEFPASRSVFITETKNMFID